jgi:hypothetical protein
MHACELCFCAYIRVLTQNSAYMLTNTHINTHIYTLQPLANATHNSFRSTLHSWMRSTHTQMPVGVVQVLGGYGYACACAYVIVYEYDCVCVCINHLVCEEKGIYRYAYSFSISRILTHITHTIYYYFRSRIYTHTLTHSHIAGLSSHFPHHRKVCVWKFCLAR